jgi:hypothetical protein
LRTSRLFAVVSNVIVFTRIYAAGRAVARAAALGPRKRSAIAAKAAKARWEKK